MKIFNATFYGTVLLIVGLFLGPIVEQNFFPITMNGNVTYQQKQPDGSLFFRFSYNKVRACIPIAFTWYKQVHNAVTLALINSSEGAGFPTRPLGYNETNTWRLSETAEMPGEYFVYILYDCDLPWLSKQKIGPFILGY